MARKNLPQCDDREHLGPLREAFGSIRAVPGGNLGHLETVAADKTNLKRLPGCRVEWKALPTKIYGKFAISVKALSVTLSTNNVLDAYAIVRQSCVTLGT